MGGKVEEGDKLGEVTHFYGKLGVAVVKAMNGPIHKGDHVLIMGHTTCLEQDIDSMQIEHHAVDEVNPGVEFGLKVRGHVRQGDVVYML